MFGELVNSSKAVRWVELLTFQEKKTLHPEIPRDSHHIIVCKFPTPQIPVRNSVKETGPMRFSRTWFLSVSF